jgi:hypothetical protein
VANIPANTQRVHLIALFESIGPIHPDPIHYSSGYCFVRYKNFVDAKQAVHKLNNKSFMGSLLRVSFAKNQSQPSAHHKQPVAKQPTQPVIKQITNDLYGTEYQLPLVYIYMDELDLFVYSQQLCQFVNQSFRVHCQIGSIMDLYDVMHLLGDDVLILRLSKNYWDQVGVVNLSMMKQSMYSQWTHWIKIHDISEPIKHFLQTQEIKN